MKKRMILCVMMMCCLLFPVYTSARTVNYNRTENYKNFVRAVTHKPIKISISYNTIGKNERKFMYKWTHLENATGYEHQISPDKKFKKDVHNQKGGPNWGSATREYTCSLMTNRAHIFIKIITSASVPYSENTTAGGVK